MPQENFLNAVASMEQALADTLSSATANSASANNLNRLLKLIIKKEIVLEFLLEEFPFPPEPPPPVGCEACSIDYNRPQLAGTLTRVGQADIDGRGNPLQIRFCPCNNPERNRVFLNFVDSQTPSGSVFEFMGSIDDINNCNADLDTGLYTGSGRVVSNPNDIPAGDYTFTMNISRDGGGNQIIVMTFTSVDTPATVFTVTLRPTANQEIDIVDCSGG